jgi:transposase
LHRAYKYRLYPTEEQAVQLKQSFAAVRWIYNAALEQRNMYCKAQAIAFFREVGFHGQTNLKKGSLFANPLVSRAQLYAMLTSQ